MEGDTHLREDGMRLGELPANIPSLLLINADVINPMKVVFETAGQVICNKNEKLIVENSDKNKVMINIEYLGEKEKEKVKPKPIRSKSKLELKSSEYNQTNSSGCLNVSPCHKMQRKHSDLCLRYDQAQLDEHLTADMLLNEHPMRRKSECAQVEKRKAKNSLEEETYHRRKARSIERVMDIEKSGSNKKKVRKVSDDISGKINIDSMSGKSTPTRHQTQTNTGLIVKDFNPKRRKSETPAFNWKEAVESGECHSPGETLGAELIKNAGERGKESDTLLQSKTSHQQKSPKHGRKSQNKLSSEASPIKTDKKSSSSSLLIPESKLLRRKSDTPLFYTQEDSSTNLPFLRRQSEAPPTLLRSSPSPTNTSIQDVDEGGRKDNLSVLEPDVTHSISESLNRLAIGNSQNQNRIFWHKWSVGVQAVNW